MTVKSLSVGVNSEPYARMEDDKQQGRIWAWYLPAIAEIITEDFPDVEDLI